MTVDYATVGLLTGDLVEIGGVRNPGLQAGGGCVYSAAGARVWSDSAGIVAVAGGDYPEEWLDLLRQGGLDTGGIERVDRPHGRTLLLSEMSYDEFGDLPALDLAPDWSGPAVSAAATPAPPRTILDDEEEFCPLPPGLPPGWGEKGVHLAPMSVRVQSSWVDSLADRARCVTLDSFWWQPGAPADSHLAMLKGISALLPSRAEVSAFFDREFTMAMLPALTEFGARLVAVKLGRDGCAVLERGSTNPVTIPSCVTEVADPTGAGDAFCGGFLVGLATTGDPLEAALRGTVSASFAVESPGVDGLLQADRTEASRRLDRLREVLVHA